MTGKRLWTIKDDKDRKRRLASLSPEQWRELAERLIPASQLLVDGWLALNVPPRAEGER